MTRSEAAKIVAVLIGTYPHAKTTPQTSEIYEEMLSDLDYAQVNTAVRRLLASSRFMPTIAEIRSAVLESERGPMRSGGEAWGDVIAAVHRYGIYRTPVFADPLTARCVTALGWEEICNSENQAADRARFIETYNSMSTSNRRELAMPASVRRISDGEGAKDLRALINRALRQLPSGDEPS